MPHTDPKLKDFRCRNDLQKDIKLLIQIIIKFTLPSLFDQKTVGYLTETRHYFKYNS
jgi:hypothetical protein